MLIDASFQNEVRRRIFLDAGGRWGVHACLILCQAGADVVRERLTHRRGDPSDADWTVYTEIVWRWEELSPRTKAMTRRVETGATKEAAVARARASRALWTVEPERAHLELVAGRFR